MLLSLRSTCATACALFVVFASANQTAADEYVSGHFRSNGKYVDGYFRSNRDGIFENNYSTKPNINPHTGKIGTRVTPPNGKPSHSVSPRYFNLPATPAAPRTPIATTPYYGPPTIPSVEDRQAEAARIAKAEAARAAKAEAARAAEIAAAKAYSDAKAQALATARAKSEQRRKAFAAELEVELEAAKSKAATNFDARKAELVAEYSQRESAAIESDKAELRIQYRELIDRFDRQQAAADQKVKADIERDRQKLAADFADREARAADMFHAKAGAGLLDNKQIREYLQKQDSIQARIAEYNESVTPERINFFKQAAATQAATTVRDELARRIERRNSELDQRLWAMKAADEKQVRQQIAKLESDFERAEGERFAADQERAERRFLAYVHGGSIDTAIEAEPVAFSRPTSASAPTANGPALTIAFGAGLGLLLAVGAILSARSKPIDFRKSPPAKW